jgi:hypothetical protein
VACDLPVVASDRPGEWAFASNAAILPAGRVIHVALGRLPLPWMTYARWAAVATMASLIGGAGIIAIRHRLPRSSP